MAAPDYAAHLGEDTYGHWSQYWSVFGSHLDSRVKNPEDAATLLMIAAVESSDDERDYMMSNDGRNIGTIAALVQYKEDLATAGMEIALTRHFNMARHGIGALYGLTRAMDYDYKQKWTRATTEALLNHTRQIPLQDLSADTGSKIFNHAYAVVSCTLALVSQMIDRKNTGDCNIDENIGNKALSLALEWMEKIDQENIDGVNHDVLYVIDKLASDEQVTAITPKIREAFAHHLPDEWIQKRIKENLPRLYPVGTSVMPKPL